MRTPGLAKSVLARSAAITRLRRCTRCRAGVSRRSTGRSRWDVEVVALEARGPHCVHQKHEMGSVLGLGVADPDRLSR